MFNSQKISLTSLLGADYAKSAAEGASVLQGIDPNAAERIITDEIDLFPEEQQRRGDDLLEKVGRRVIAPFTGGHDGAASDSFKNAAKINASPLGGYCCTRLGEDGYLYFTGKSEHYHASLGHGFNGYKLANNARALGIPNATHNNTRGFITRTLERELINEIADSDKKTLDRVVNLETGSVAAEAGIKMMLNRFYKSAAAKPDAPNKNKTPVFLVMRDDNGGPGANYHGTAFIAQTLRGMWPEFAAKAEEIGLYKTVPVVINDIEDFKAKLIKYNQGRYKTAGFLHEIILMNYGAVRLEKTYLREAYELCRKYDTPVLVDEIQSCMWYREMFLFKRYGLKPDFVVIGKGFAGGEYPASKIITTGGMDTLDQFGALVTNGQEEIASLIYLITMLFVKINGEQIESLSGYFFDKLRELPGKYPSLLDRIEGMGHLAGVRFHNAEDALEFARSLNGEYIDVSVQAYKKDFPPSVLLKPPVTASRKCLDFFIGKMDNALAGLPRIKY